MAEGSKMTLGKVTSRHCTKQMRENASAALEAGILKFRCR